MHEAANLPSAVMAVTLTTTALESGLVALALAMLVALLVVRSKRAHDQKLRKAASMGYYDPDVARYGYGSPAVPAEPPIDFDEVPLAPSFVAPGRGRATRRNAAGARPAPASFGSMRLDPPRPVPAFDQASVVAPRPVSDIAPPPPASTLPPLVQPPPPVGAPTERDSVSSPDDRAGR
jgi:hypothetical protein